MSVDEVRDAFTAVGFHASTCDVVTHTVVNRKLDVTVCRTFVQGFFHKPTGVF